MLSVFISYRRSDSRQASLRLKDRLVRDLRGYQIFFDTASITPGDQWRTKIDEAIKQSEVMIIVIGKTWLQPRLFEAEDVVRHEIEEGVKRELFLIPILIEGAQFPSSDALPNSIRVLAEYNALRIVDEDDDNYRVSVERLITAIRTWKQKNFAAKLIIEMKGTTDGSCEVFINEEIKGSLDERKPTEIGIDPGYYSIHVTCTFTLLIYNRGGGSPFENPGEKSTSNSLNIQIDSGDFIYLECHASSTKEVLDAMFRHFPLLSVRFLSLKHIKTIHNIS